MIVVNNKIENIYPLTPLQEGMLFHNLLEKNNTEYVLQMQYVFKYVLDSDLLSEALDLLSQRFTSLRTLFIYEKVKTPSQVIMRERKPEFIEYDWSNMDTKEFEAAYTGLVRDDVSRGFDLSKDTLLRVTHVINGDCSRIVFTMHHIIVDGWCLGTIFSKLLDYYSELAEGTSFDILMDEVINERETNPDYGDYIKWLKKQDTRKAFKYWEKLLDGYDSECEIKPMQKAEQSFVRTHEKYVTASKETTTKLMELAKGSNCTVNSVTEAAIGILLQRMSRNNDVVFGKVVSGRNVDINGIESMVGLFINTIPIRVNSGAEVTVRELVESLSKQGVESDIYNYCSLADIQKLTQQGSDLIKTIYVFENYSSGASEPEEAQTYTIVDAREETNYPISFSGFAMNNEIGFKVMYDTGKFTDNDIDLILDKIVNILDEMAANPDQKVCELETVPEKEKKLILNDFNATERAYQKDNTIVELLEDQVSKTPGNDAVVFGDKKLSYAELNERANVLGNKLRELGVKPDDFVAIIADRSIEMIAGIYGIIKSGEHMFR